MWIYIIIPIMFTIIDILGHQDTNPLTFIGLAMLCFGSGARFAQELAKRV